MLPALLISGARLQPSPSHRPRLAETSLRCKYHSLAGAFPDPFMRPEGKESDEQAWHPLRKETTRSMGSTKRHGKRCSQRKGPVGINNRCFHAMGHLLLPAPPTKADGGEAAWRGGTGCTGPQEPQQPPGECAGGGEEPVILGWAQSRGGQEGDMGAGLCGGRAA